MSGFFHHVLEVTNHNKDHSICLLRAKQEGKKDWERKRLRKVERGWEKGRECKMERGWEKGREWKMERGW